MSAAPLRLPSRVHVLLLLGSVLVALFGFVYARLVCVFICTLSSGTLGRNIAIVSLFHVVLRHQLLAPPLPGSAARTPARSAYLRSVASWFVAGGLAIGLH